MTSWGRLSSRKTKTFPSRNKLSVRGLPIPLAEDVIKAQLWAFFRKNVWERGCDVTLNEDVRNALRETTRYVIGGEKCGLFVSGRIGCGKTALCVALRNMINFLVSQGVLDVPVTEYGKGGARLVSAIEMVHTYLRSDEDFDQLMKVEYLILDDLGSEPCEVMKYGTRFYPFYEILSFRYNNRLPMVISTNLSAKDFCRYYGDKRIDDRMKEMFQVLSFNGGSFR